jgi:glycosyltransferase involved in cell wall biosynthesis
MACGAYCIATRIPANKQWIINNENGRLVEINDISGLAEIIIESYKNYDLISAKAEMQNKIIIKEKADWFVNMQIVESKYRELCKKK